MCEVETAVSCVCALRGLQPSVTTRGHACHGEACPLGFCSVPFLLCLFRASFCCPPSQPPPGGRTLSIPCISQFRCCNRTPLTGWLKQQKCVSRSPSSRCQLIGSCENPQPRLQMALWLCPQLGERKGANCLVSSSKGTNPIVRAPPSRPHRHVIPSQRAPS